MSHRQVHGYIAKNISLSRLKNIFPGHTSFVNSVDCARNDKPLVLSGERMTIIFHDKFMTFMISCVRR